MNIKKQTNKSQLEKRKKKETMYYDIIKKKKYIYIYIYIFIAQTIKFVAEKQRS